MDSDANIVIIGAGSASFGLDNLSGIIAHENLQNTTVKLVDIQENSLKAISALGEVMKREWDSKIEIMSFLDRKQALIDADFVILSVAIDREETWLKDYQIAEKYGYYEITLQLFFNDVITGEFLEGGEVVVTPPKVDGSDKV